MTFRDIELTEDTHLRVWRQVPWEPESEPHTVVEIWEDEIPEDADGKGKPPVLLGRLALDDVGRQALVGALTCDPPENLEPCPTCEGKGGAVTTQYGAKVTLHPKCPDCGL